MKCPACARKLTEIKVGAVALDVCQGGCGGVWFDADELTHVNDQHRKSGRGLQVSRDETITVDDALPRHCPVCPRTRLMRRLFSLGTGVEMDCCPKCQGVWLDFGELEAIQIETNPKPHPVRPVMPRKSRSLAINFNVVEQIHAQQVSIRHQNQRPAR